MNIRKAKTHLSRLLVHVGNGEEVIIARAGRPVARLVPTKAKPGHREPGSAAGKVIIMPDFDAPLPEDVVRAFEG